MTAAAVKPTPATGVGELRAIPVEQLQESPWNPRSRFDGKKLDELAESLKTQGQLAPIVVRPNGEGGSGPERIQLYEIGAGHRRFRAAVLAGLTSLLAVVRDLDDVTFLELLVFENGNRNDLHPLEEAAGYRRLMEQAGYTVPRIAERDGRSVEYVYGRLKLLQLTKKAKQLFLADEFTAGHAVLIARLPATVQDELVDPDDGALWQSEESLWRPSELGGDDLESGYDVKPVSVKELEKWIAEHVRFTPDHVDPILFPETADIIAQATSTKEKVVQITCDNSVHPDARGDQTVTIGPRSWKRADGRFKSKKCEHSVIGVVAVGPGQGEAFRVCVNKNKCSTHWPEQVKARKAAAQRAKATAIAPPTGSAEKQEKIKAAAALKPQQAEQHQHRVEDEVLRLIQERAPQWALGVVALSKQIKLPAAFAAWMARGRRLQPDIENDIDYGDAGERARHVFNAMRPKLGGGWSRDGLPETAAAQPVAMALLFWLANSLKSIEAELERDAEKVVVAEEKAAAAKAAAKKPAKKKAKK